MRRSAVSAPWESSDSTTVRRQLIRDATDWGESLRVTVQQCWRVVRWPIKGRLVFERQSEQYIFQRAGTARLVPGGGLLQELASPMGIAPMWMLQIIGRVLSAG